MVSQGDCRSSWQSSDGWMPESVGKWSVGVEHRHPVTMEGVIQDIVYEASVSAVTPDDAWYSVVE